MGRKMNLRNLIKWSAIFLAILAYKQYGAAESSKLSAINDIEQHHLSTHDQGPNQPG
jgi:hypothetical protein